MDQVTQRGQTPPIRIAGPVPARSITLKRRAAIDLKGAAILGTGAVPVLTLPQGPTSQADTGATTATTISPVGLARLFRRDHWSAHQIAPIPRARSQADRTVKANGLLGGSSSLGCIGANG